MPSKPISRLGFGRGGILAGSPLADALGVGALACELTASEAEVCVRWVKAWSQEPPASRP